MGILTGKWRYQDIALVHMIQTAVYVAFSSFEVLKREGILESNVDDSVKRDLVFKRVTNVLNRRVSEGVLYAFDVGYDPTVWQGKPFLVCKLRLQPDPSPGYWKLRLDFSKPVSEGVVIWHEDREGKGEWLDIDVTQVKLEV